MKKYVVGFAFCIGSNFVYLIRKSKPEWQAGKLNGVGGKVEENEEPYDAMVREFKEETDVDVTNWLKVGVMGSDDGWPWQCHIYAAIVTPAQMQALDRTVVHHYEQEAIEPIVLCQVENISQGLGVNSEDRYPYIDNVPLLIEAAKYTLDNEGLMSYFTWEA